MFGFPLVFEAPLGGDVDHGSWYEIPFHLASDADPATGVTGHTFVLGEVQIKLPSSVVWLSVSPDRITEIGYGDYVIALDASQVATDGYVFSTAHVTGSQPWSGYELIGPSMNIGGIAVNEPSSAKRYLPFHLSDATDPLTPVTGHSFVTGEVKIRLPGGGYANADVSQVAEIGNGDYVLVLSPTQVATAGLVFLAALVTGAQTWTSAYRVLGPKTTITVTPPTPLPIVTSSTVVAEVIDHSTDALKRLCEFAKRRAA